MADSSEDLIGVSLGSYRVESFLGAGGMGSVYLARHETLGRLVAVKVLSIFLCSDEQYVQRFLREARLAASMHHPHLVEVYDFGESKHGHFMAMEFIKGMSLGQLLQSQGKLTEQQTIDVANQALSALAYAHDAGVIHRDIKPDNLLIQEDGSLKVTDLGLAKGVSLDEDQSLTMSGMVLGTPLYIPPEQVRGDKEIDGRADLYSLGATLFHCATGRPPYMGNTSALIMNMHLSDPVPHPRHTNPDLSEAFATFIIRLMQKNPDYRFVTAKEAGEALDQIRGTDQVLAKRVKEVVILDEEVTWAQRIPSLAIKTGLIALLLGGGWWFWNKQASRPKPQPIPITQTPVIPPLIVPTTPSIPGPKKQPDSNAAPSDSKPAAAPWRAVILGAQSLQIIQDGQLQLPGDGMTHITPVEVDSTHQMFLRFDIEAIQNNMLRNYRVAPDIRKVDLILIAQIQSATPSTRLKLSRLKSPQKESMLTEPPFVTIPLPKTRQVTNLLLNITDEYRRAVRDGENFGWILSLEGEGKILVASSSDPILQSIPSLSFSAGLPEESLPATPPLPH